MCPKTMTDLCVANCGVVERFAVAISIGVVPQESERFLDNYGCFEARTDYSECSMSEDFGQIDPRYYEAD